MSDRQRRPKGRRSKTARETHGRKDPSERTTEGLTPRNNVIGTWKCDYTPRPLSTEHRQGIAPDAWPESYGRRQGRTMEKQSTTPMVQSLDVADLLDGISERIIGLVDLGRHIRKGYAKGDRKRATLALLMNLETLGSQVAEASALVQSHNLVANLMAEFCVIGHEVHYTPTPTTEPEPESDTEAEDEAALAAILVALAPNPAETLAVAPC